MTAVSDTWRKLLCSLPGYDPFAQAEGCWFDEKAAQLALDFIEHPEDGCIRHVEGALVGKPFTLQPWQRAFVANLFGWKRKDELGRVVRRFRESLLYVPRKNGKTPLVAALALLVLFCDGEAGAQCYVAAGDRDQAGMLFRQAKGMVERDDALTARCKVYGGRAAAGQSRSIVREDDGSYLRVLSADADTKHGGNTHLAIIDELHVQKDRDLYDVLRTSMASQNRPQPLFISVTTADFMRQSICNEVYEYASRVRDGAVHDPTFLPCIFEATKDDAWDDPKTWAKANPNLGVSVSREYLEREFKKAKQTPSYENTFKRLHLNLRTEQDVRAIPMDKWRACCPLLYLPNRSIDIAKALAWRQEKIASLKGRTCVAGLDLGSTSDLTAFALLFPPVDKRWILLPYFWVPREAAELRAKHDRVDYPLWIRQGFVLETPGAVTDYDQVRKDVNHLGVWFSIRSIAGDRAFQGEQLLVQLREQDGFDVVAWGQGFLSMFAPTKKILELITDARLDHGANPVLTWQASHASTESDHSGCIKFSKKKSAEKIDGLVAGTSALGRLMELNLEAAGGDGGGAEFW